MAPVNLIASAWTTAGDAAPQRGDELSPHPLEQRIAWAAETGWNGVGLLHADLVAFEREGGEPARLRDEIARAGLEFVELEFLVDWWTEGERRAASDATRRDLLRLSGQLGAIHVKAAGDFSGQPVDEEAMVREMRALGDDAAAHGTRIALEALPMTNFRTTEDGARFVEAVDHPAVGLCVDIWHVMRGGTRVEDLPQILANARVFAVELNDAPLTGLPDLWTDTVDNRRLVGQGEWDVPAFIRAMEQAGFDGPWGVEILSAEYRLRDVPQALAEAYRTTIAAFGAAHAAAR